MTNYNPERLIVVISDSEDKMELYMNTGIERDTRKRTVDIELTEHQKNRLGYQKKKILKA